MRRRSAAHAGKPLARRNRLRLLSILFFVLIILIIAIFFTGFKDNEYVIRAFKGIRPVVVALIGLPMYDMIRATKMKWWSWTVMVISLILVTFLKVSPIYILICVIVMALFISWYNEKHRK